MDNNEMPILYQNRELSWLKFNQRVLEQSCDMTIPLLERLKFISIFSNNLDEFFMIRVGTLTDASMLEPQAVDNKSKMTPAEQLEAIFPQVRELIDKKDVYKRQQHARPDGPGRLRLCCNGVLFPCARPETAGGTAL